VRDAQKDPKRLQGLDQQIGVLSKVPEKNLSRGVRSEKTNSRLYH
jgi:hypothetical protein